MNAIPNSTSGLDSDPDEDKPASNVNGDGWNDQYYVTKRGGESFNEIAKKVGITPELLLRMNVDIKDHRGRPIRCRPKTKMAKGSTLWVPDGYWEQSEQEKPIALVAKEMDRPARALKIVEADDFIHECA